MSDKESTGPGGDNLSAVANQYRTHNGLGERTTDEPETNTVTEESADETSQDQA